MKKSVSVVFFDPGAFVKDLARNRINAALALGIKYLTGFSVTQPPSPSQKILAYLFL
jgi:hypothetical protein